MFITTKMESRFGFSKKLDLAWRGEVEQISLGRLKHRSGHRLNATQWTKAFLHELRQGVEVHPKRCSRQRLVIRLCEQM
jgi:hypothetical protein